MLAEARGFRLGLVLAHQDLAQLPTRPSPRHLRQRPHEDLLHRRPGRRPRAVQAHHPRAGRARPRPPRRPHRRRPAPGRQPGAARVHVQDPAADPAPGYAYALRQQLAAAHPSQDLSAQERLARNLTHRNEDAARSTTAAHAARMAPRIGPATLPPTAVTRRAGRVPPEHCGAECAPPAFGPCGGRRQPVARPVECFGIASSSVIRQIPGCSAPRAAHLRKRRPITQADHSGIPPGKAILMSSSSINPFPTSSPLTPG